MSVAFLYPGQGAQIPGMLHQLPERAQATWTLQEASQVLGRDVLTLDTEQALSSTVPVQLAVFVGNLNAPTQFVIAGSDSGIEAVLNRAKNEGARSAKRLEVSVPSHCVL